MTTATVILLAMMISVVGCGRRDIPPFPEVELHRSAPQSLIVKNLTERTIHIIPDNNGGSSVSISSGKDWTTHFSVVTNASLSESGVVVAGSERNNIEPIGNTRYLTLFGEDWVLKAGPLGESWEHGMFLANAGLSNQPALGRII